MKPAILGINETNPPLKKHLASRHRMPTHIFTIDGTKYACRVLPKHYQNSEDYVRASKAPNRAVTYYASICGKIISRNGNNVVRLKSLHKKKNNNGSIRVHVVLCQDGVQTNYYAHRLIAAAFCTGMYKRDAEGNRKKMVNHIDENMENNHAANLEWVSGSTNFRHSAYITPAWRMERGETTASDDRALEVIEDFLTGEMSLGTLIQIHGCSEVTRALRIAGFFSFTESASEVLHTANEDVSYVSRESQLALAV